MLSSHPDSASAGANAGAALLVKIGNFVLTLLQKPAGFQRVQVRPLWDEHYRANVIAGVDAEHATIVQSYFLDVDESGSVVRCRPEIARQF